MDWNREMKMSFKNLRLLILFICFFLVMNEKSFTQTTWPLQSDSMNLAILVLDFQTYQFEKGHFSVHNSCESCDADSLPFEKIFKYPVDFGSIAFIYTETWDTLFYAGIVWNGAGKIHYPAQFLPADSFNTIQTTIKDPKSIEYFNFWPVPDDSTFKVKADSAWYFVKFLDIVEDFSKNPFLVGIYLYTPSVGEFQPTVAKWIIFLYQGRLSNTGFDHMDQQSPPQLILFQNYPNPFNPTTEITYVLPKDSDVNLMIFNLSGQLVRILDAGQRSAGIHTVQWDATDDDGNRVASGVYITVFKAGHYVEQQRMVFIK